MAEQLAALAAALADRYTIARELGAGGMAVVYLAHDVKHNRKVALKVLRPELAHAIGPDRFLREIETTANLRHPHILPLYDSGMTGGRADGQTGGATDEPPASSAISHRPSAEFLFYVMPFVEGESLRDRLDREKQLPLDDALQIAREVADALSYAHSRGVIHRDIKPENILLESGHAVVADFGIARAVDAAGGAQLTETGLAIGTPTYMSPEQAAGARELDGRSDLYALGCVLYEMLAGQPPFTGPTIESVIHQHLTAEPPNITTIRPAVPAAIGGVLLRALAKTPADRFSPAAQFAEALQSQRLSENSGTPGARPPGTRRILGIGASFLVVVATLAIMWLVRSSDEAALVAGRATQITFDAGLELDPVLSPDGSMVAYAAGPIGQERIYLRPVTGGRPIALTDGATRSRNPQWTPDGTRISFESPEGVYAVPTLGGAASRLFPGSASGLWSHVWSPDGREVAYATVDSVVVRSMETGETRLAAALYFPSSLDWSADGRWIAAASGNASFVFGIVGRQTAYNQQAFANVAPTSLWILPTDGRPPVQVTGGDHMDMSPSWLPDGRLLFMSDRDGSRDLYVLTLRDDATPDGEPLRVTAGLSIHTARVSRDGTQIVYSRFEPRANIWAIAIPGVGSASIAAARRLTSGSQLIEGLAISSDGRWLAFDSDRSGNQDIFKMELPDGEPIRLTTHPAADFVWSWSWDDASLLGHTFRHGFRDPFELAADGSRFTVIARDSVHERYPSLSPDRRMVVTDRDFGPVREVTLRTRQDDGTWGPARFLTKESGGGATFSPDGSSILFTNHLLAGTAVVMDTAGHPSTVLSGPDGSHVTNARWTPDGARIVFKTRSPAGVQALWAAPASGGARRQLVRFDDPSRPWLRDEFATDGRSIYLVLSEHESDIWVMDIHPTRRARDEHN